MIGQMLASLVDMAKGQLGDQFAVTILARHKRGPMHLLLGDDTELAMIGALSELQRVGTTLVKDGDAVELPEVTTTQQMFNLLQEAAEFLHHDGLSSAAREADKLACRIDQVLDMVNPKAKVCPRCVEPLPPGSTGSASECPICTAGTPFLNPRRFIRTPPKRDPWAEADSELDPDRLREDQQERRRLDKERGDDVDDGS